MDPDLLYRSRERSRGVPCEMLCISVMPRTAEDKEKLSFHFQSLCRELTFAASGRASGPAKLRTDPRHRNVGDQKIDHVVPKRCRQHDHCGDPADQEHDSEAKSDP